jgi:hypothetical protein
MWLGHKHGRRSDRRRSRRIGGERAYSTLLCCTEFELLCFYKIKRENLLLKKIGQCILFVCVCIVCCWERPGLCIEKKTTLSYLLPLPNKNAIALNLDYSLRKKKKTVILALNLESSCPGSKLELHFLLDGGSMSRARSYAAGMTEQSMKSQGAG